MKLTYRDTDKFFFEIFRSKRYGPKGMAVGPKVEMNYRQNLKKKHEDNLIKPNFGKLDRVFYGF